MSVQPTYFIPHGGGPCFFMDDPRGVWSGMEAFLRSLPNSLAEKPKAILVVSGHWETDGFALTGAERPELIYDYHNFPPHTYQLRYDVPGSPALAARAAALLKDAGIPSSVDAKRGLDHGVFVPLKVAFPDADIPLIEMSVERGLNPALHVAAGRALAPLRKEGVLILGSGMSFHNMRVRGPQATAPSERFDAALTDAVTDPDPRARDARLADWRAMPEAEFSHPREEHLIPLMVAAGAGADDPGSHAHRSTVIGWTVSGYRFG